jgi:5-formyltetrahydrofolate cyclo-ligase
MVKSDKTIVEEKDKIRRAIISRLRSQDIKERTFRSHKIQRRLLKETFFKRAESIMIYVAKDYEVETRGIIEEAIKSGKRVIIPVTETKKKRLILSEIRDLKTELAKGAFGIYEPKREYMKTVGVKDIDIVVVPGIAFDKRGNRIGHGKGYFDKFLKNLPKKIPTIGLAFKFQIIKRIKTLSWDIPVTKVITA